MRTVKKYEWNHFKFKYLRRILSAADNERAVPYPDIAFWVGAARSNCRKTAAVRLQPRGRLKEDFMYLFTFSNGSNAGILLPIFT
jgi:hypothetical protein